MEIFGIALGMAFFWIVLAVILIIVEACTVGLVTIWFAGGALVAALTTLFTPNVFIQIAVFLAVSIVLLYLTKPLRVKLKIGKEKTNVEAVIGKTGFVTEPISPAAFGQVKVGGIIWTDMAEEREIEVGDGTEVIVSGVEGVKLIGTTAYNKN